jgi:hypothetical protein
MKQKIENILKIIRSLHKEMDSYEYITPISSPTDSISNVINRPIKNRLYINDQTIDSDSSASPTLVRRRLEFTDISYSPPNNNFDYNQLDTVGECGICYDRLPLRSNHIFTVCGHLFCVKCLFNWNNSSATCPLCRENLYDNVFIDDELHMLNDSYNENTHEIIIRGLDRYIYDDDGIDWTNSVVLDDDVMLLTDEEKYQLRLDRSITMGLVCRSLFSEYLFKNIDFKGEIYHTFIPRIDYINLLSNSIENLKLFEFVLSRNTIYDGSEMNFFGYILEISVIDVLNSEIEENITWSSTHEYCFKVNVFNPNKCSYNVDIGTFETKNLIFRFSEIRRMYYISHVLYR